VDAPSVEHDLADLHQTSVTAELCSGFLDAVSVVPGLGPESSVTVSVSCSMSAASAPSGVLHCITLLCRDARVSILCMVLLEFLFMIFHWSVLMYVMPRVSHLSYSRLHVYSVLHGCVVCCVAMFVCMCAMLSSW
jgi:hypothetical protein